MRRDLTLLLTVSTLAAPAGGQGLVLEVFGEPGVPHGHYGAAVSAIGDVDQDGFDDVLVGAPNAASTAEIVSGATGTRIHLLDAPTTDDRFGAAVLGPGDLDLDGVPDAVVGAYLSSAGGASSGAVHAYSGATGLLLWTHAGQPSDFVGFGLGPAGDHDLDGTPDILAAAPAGAVVVLSGASGAPLATFAVPFAPWEVDGGEDVDQDGVPDLIVGTPTAGPPHHSGRVEVISGATGATLHAVAGAAQQEFTGHAVELLGDVDGDGGVDFAVGETGASFGGRVRVFSGQTGAVLWSAFGAPSWNAFGSTLAELPDVTGDGRPDLLVGANHGSAESAGGAIVLGGASGGVFFAVDGHDFLGEVAFVGDVNGDEEPDFAVGAQHATGSDGVSISGAARVYSTVCGDVLPLGQGCPGTAGIVPLLSLDGCLTPGGAFALGLSNGLGGAPALLLLGSPAGLPLGAGCLLGVDPSSAIAVTTVLAGAGAGNGSLYVPGEVPLDAPLGFVYLQAIVLDPASPIGISATRRLRAKIE